MHSIGIACIVIALLLELGSYYRQIAKTLRTKKSKDVSSTSYLMKVIKYLITMVGLSIFANWAGLVMEIVSLIACLAALTIVIRFKPKNWRLL